MAEPQSGPCDVWVTEEDVRKCCPGLDPAFDLTDVIQFASSVLFRLSGRQYPGLCERTVRPCYGTNCGCMFSGWNSMAAGWWWPSFPFADGGGPFPAVSSPDGSMLGFGVCSGKCNLSTISLPAPVVAVTEVVIDGAILSPSAYRIEAFQEIKRVDGDHWPCTNDMAEPSDHTDGVAGTWEISYTFGRSVPPEGKYACALFACQLAKARCGATDCRLPQRVQTIARQGVTMSFADPMMFVDNGQVGIYEIDLWLHGVNPWRLPRRSTVRRADDPKHDAIWTD